MPGPDIRLGILCTPLWSSWLTIMYSLFKAPEQSMQFYCPFYVNVVVDVEDNLVWFIIIFGISVPTLWLQFCGSTEETCPIPKAQAPSPPSNGETTSLNNWSWPRCKRSRISSRRWPRCKRSWISMKPSWRILRTPFPSAHRRPPRVGRSEIKRCC